MKRNTYLVYIDMLILNHLLLNHVILKPKDDLQAIYLIF